LSLDSNRQVVIAQVHVQQCLQPPTIRVRIIDRDDAAIAKDWELLAKRDVRDIDFLNKGRLLLGVIDRRGEGAENR
jgi:hypothetical protein